MNGLRSTLATPSGAMRVYETAPAGAEKRPGLVLLMDGLGFRPTLFAIADRFAAQGLRVVVPDLFHRVGPDVHFDAKEVFGNPEKLAAMRKQLAGVTADPAMEDVRACLDHLAAAPDASGRLGAIGYCMGGRFALIAAARFPEHLGAVASIHGGRLVTPEGDSPHLDAPRVKASLYFAIAQDDTSFTAADEATLRAALEAAGTRFEMEHYGARHGWTMADAPVHDPAEAERHVQRAGAFLTATLAGT